MISHSAGILECAKNCNNKNLPIFSKKIVKKKAFEESVISIP